MPTRGDRFRAAMTSGPIILDAAMGTRLIATGLKLDRDDPALWNLSHPEAIAEIHRRDRAAGADALTTNTFGANRSWLGRFHQADRFEEINRRAVVLARDAAGVDGLVIGDIGPTGLGIPGAVRDQAEVLADAGVDALLFETFQLDQAELALREVAGHVGIPLLVSLYIWPDPIAGAARRLLEAGADVLGMNCQPGMETAIEFAGRIRGVTGCPLLVRPSSANPIDSSREGESFAEAVPRLLGLGVGLLGGCCGTTEVHVAALRNACYAGHLRR